MNKAKVHVAGRDAMGKGPWSLAMLVGLLSLPDPARADQATFLGTASQPKVDEFYGSFQQDIPIVVPPYRGIEPRLALHYSSSAGNGFVGQGWSLSGFSVIERASRGRGAPKYDSDDIYILEGQELTPCSTQPQPPVSPSCTSGGTHSTKIESYLRIKFDSAANTWTVTGQNGGKSTYGAVYNTASGTFRWGLSSVTDTLNNTVTYNWWCDGTADCYPSTVTYNSVTITLWRETRTDATTFANGLYVGTTSYRLKTIDATVSGSRLQTYKLGYTMSASGKSQLTSAQIYGKDAEIDGSGTVTAGTSLPAQTFQYSVGGAMLGTGTSHNGSWLSSIDTRCLDQVNYELVFKDFNGDGRTDVACREKYYGNSIKVALSTGTGFGPMTEWFPNGGSAGCGILSVGNFADVNGDGKVDFICIKDRAGTAVMKVALSDGTKFGPGNGAFNGDWLSAPSACAYANGDSIYDFSDYNGDGKADALCIQNGVVSVALSDGTKFGTGTAPTFTYAPAVSFGNPSVCAGLAGSPGGPGGPYMLPAGAHFIDFNGDGKTDILCHYVHGSVFPSGVYIGYTYVYLSTGSGFVKARGQAADYSGKVGQFICPHDGSEAPILADFNGDGKTDWGCFSNDTSDPGRNGLFYIGLSDGGSFNTRDTPVLSQFCGGWNLSTTNPQYWEDVVVPADVNGDGMIDLTCVRYDNGAFPIPHAINVRLADGKGGFGSEQQWQAQACSTTFSSYRYEIRPRVSFGDFNGDGKADAVCVQSIAPGTGSPDDRIQYWVSLSGNTSTLPDSVMTRSANGIGATTQITYTPSSAWSNTNFPLIVQTVSSLTTADGRGWTTRTDYSYSGALWDYLDRRFLGFHYAKATLPCITDETACPYGETWFKQDYGSVAKPERMEQHNGAGVLLSATVNEYTTNGATLPYTSLQTGLWQFSYDGSAIACTPWSTDPPAQSPCDRGVRTYEAYAFDNYGNIYQTRHYGDYDVNGDEWTKLATYVPNTGSFIVSLPADLKTLNGIGTTGDRLNETLFYYDGASTWNQAPSIGNVTQSLAWLDTTDSFIVPSTRVFDSYGNVVSETDARGTETRYTIDPTYHLFVTDVTYAVGTPLERTTTSAYDTICGLKQVTDPLSRSTTTDYDALCRKKRVDMPGGTYATFSWPNLGDPNNQYEQTLSSDGTWTRQFKDGLGRVYRTVKSGAVSDRNITTEIVFNARGLVDKTSAPYYTGDTPQWSTTTYDALDRATRITAPPPDGAFTTRLYGAHSVTFTDELGSAVTDQRNGSTDRHIERLDGIDYVTTTQRNSLGRPIQITDSAGTIRRFFFDSLGRKTRVEDPNHGVSTFSYDPIGNITASQDAKGQRLEAELDALSRKKRAISRYADGTIERTVTFGYDEARPGYYNLGQPTSMSDPSSTETYDYDLQGHKVRTVHTIDGVTYTTYTAFDSNGRLLGIKYPDNDVVGTDPTTAIGTPFGYDGAGRLYSIPGIVNSIQYDAAGNTTVRQNANGTTTTLGYSPTRGWLDTIFTAAGAGPAIQNLTYTRDAAGQIRIVTSPFPNEGWTYTYDELHRLKTAVNTSDPSNNQSFTIDPVGNITSNSAIGTYTYPAPTSPRPHAVIAAGLNTYSYDDNGNMTSGAGRTMTWTVENLPATISNGGSTTTFAYDGAQNRLKKTVDALTTIYLGDDYEIGNDGVATKYFSAGGMLVAKRTGLQTFWLHTDQQGSIQAITDENGAEKQRITYRPYGGRLSTSTSFEESRGFTGQRQDETGLLYLHARYYDPELGRFISPDPMFSTESAVRTNGYAYCGNDPINHTDPSGLLFGWLKSAFKAVAHMAVSYVLPMALNFVLPGAGVAMMIARGAVAGVIMSGIAGRGVKGMLIGAAMGAGTGAMGWASSIKNPVGRYAAQASINFEKGTLQGRLDGKSWGAAARGAAINTSISIGADVGYKYSIGALSHAGVSTTALGQANKSLSDSTIGIAPPDPGAYGAGGEHSRLMNLLHRIPKYGRLIEAISAPHDAMGGTLGYWADIPGIRVGVQSEIPFGGFFKSKWWNIVGMGLAAALTDRALSFEEGRGGSLTDTERGIIAVVHGIEHHSGGGDSGGGRGGGDQGGGGGGGGGDVGGGDSGGGGRSEGGGRRDRDEGCFLAGTPVTMADGSTKNIEDIGVGERVTAYDSKTGQLVTANVLQVFVHTDIEGIMLINGFLRATPNHPFFANGRFMRADQLNIGDALEQLPARATLSDGTQAAAVMSLEEFPGSNTVYNLEVEEVHTYFAGGFLVHNRKDY